MKLFCTGMLMLLASGTATIAVAQLQLVPDTTAPCVFAGDTRKINVTWQNSSDKTVEVKIWARIFQASSATTVLWSDAVWKQLMVLPGQTVLESAQLSFPSVTAQTRFMVQWLAATNKTILGVTTVWVYPTNQLTELKSLAAGRAVGVFDPENELKPLLKNSGISFVDLEKTGLENFSGRQAIIGMLSSAAPPDKNFVKQIRVLVRKNVAVVWIQSPAERAEKLTPSFYSMVEGTNAAVVVQADLVSDFSENPQAQRNLIYFCKLALDPKSAALSELAIEP